MNDLIIRGNMSQIKRNNNTFVRTTEIVKSNLHLYTNIF